jgi:hypothetical protein
MTIGIAAGITVGIAGQERAQQGEACIHLPNSVSGKKAYLPPPLCTGLAGGHSPSTAAFKKRHSGFMVLINATFFSRRQPFIFFHGQ